MKKIKEGTIICLKKAEVNILEYDASRYAGKYAVFQRHNKYDPSICYINHIPSGAPSVVNIKNIRVVAE